MKPMKPYLLSKMVIASFKTISLLYSLCLAKKSYDKTRTRSPPSLVKRTRAESVHKDVCFCSCTIHYWWFA